MLDNWWLWVGTGFTGCLRKGVSAINENLRQEIFSNTYLFFAKYFLSEVVPIHAVQDVLDHPKVRLVEFDYMLFVSQIAVCIRWV